MQTKLEISRQAELFPSSGFFQPRKGTSFFSAPLHASLPSKSRNGGFCSRSQTNDCLSSLFRIARLLSIVVTLKPGGSRQLSNRIRDAPSLSFFVELPAKSVRKPPGSTMVTLTPQRRCFARQHFERNLQRPISQPSRSATRRSGSFLPSMKIEQK